jgi:hypothetical protein
MIETNTYLKRGEGKIKGTIKKSSFYDYYKTNAKEPVISRIVYNKFLKELLQAFSTNIVETGLELKINKIGKIRVKSNNLKLVNKNGEVSKKLKINWKATWDYWHSKYPELTKQQITELTDKRVIFHDNEHTNYEFYSHHWDNLSIPLKFKSFYNFKPSRQYSRLIAKIVKDPNRKTFYYG